MSPDAPRHARRKALAALTVAVVLAHLALLQGKPTALGLSPPPSGPSVSTRAVELVPPPGIPPRPAARHHKTPAMPAPVQTAAPALWPTAGQGETPQRPPAVEVPESAAPPELASAPDEAPAPALPLPRERAPLASSYTLPGSVRLKYQVSANKFPFSLNAELLWQQSGDSYEARLEFGAFGQARVQTSRGQVTSQGLAPLRFSDKYRSEVAAHFEREKGKVTFSANTPDVPLLGGAQDRLSILVQLAAMIAGDPARFPAATTITLQAVGPRDADTWLFTVGSEETLSLPGGELATLRLVRNPRKEFDQKVELWLAPALGYMPARLRITEQNGDFIDQKWLASEPPV